MKTSWTTTRTPWAWAHLLGLPGLQLVYEDSLDFNSSIGLLAHQLVYEDTLDFSSSMMTFWTPAILWGLLGLQLVYKNTRNFIWSIGTPELQVVFKGFLNFNCKSSLDRDSLSSVSIPVRPLRHPQHFHNLSFHQPLLFIFQYSIMVRSSNVTEP